MSESLIGKIAYIHSGWNFAGGKVTVIQDDDKGVRPNVKVKYENGDEVEFDKQFIEKYINA